MSKIKVMSPTLANMIAAGEVIERPSSVIKELVENSIDAKAKNIQVQIFNAGKQQIIVKDDGIGMDQEDALLAFKRHASSKLTSIYDLPRISTLGFRGEAIPSIASISKVELYTSDGKSGTHVSSSPDEELKSEPSSLRLGTTFEIKELFFNTPARLKYLKSDKTETQSCIEVIQHLALGFPSISFKMYVDNNLVLNTTGRGDLLEVISIIYGNNIAKNCIKIDVVGDGFTGTGFIGHPSFSYSNRYNILTFLNNRTVYIPKVNKAIIDAYKDYLPPSRYPIIFISFDVDYSLVDVNVHPTKKEVRLSCEDDLAKRTYNQVLVSLSKTRGSFDQVEIPQVKVISFSNETKPSLDSSSLSNMSLDINPKPAEFNSNIDLNQDNSTYINDKPFEEKLTFEDSSTLNDTNQNIQTQIVENKQGGFSVANANGFISDVNVKNIVVKSNNFPSLVPIGQILQTYIVCDSDDGMYLIDQHAAAERINFEKCEDEFNQDITYQIPLIPIIVDLTPSLKANYDQEHIKALQEVGLCTSYFSSNSIRVDQIPTSLVGEENIGIVNDIITQVLSDRNISIKEVKRLAIATKACKMSIKANHILTKELMVKLIENLSKCRNPLNCPHGRPTVVKISKYDIEKLFKRTGF